MQDNDWHKIDLNLLKVLVVLGEEKNTTNAAKRLFVGQSAISKSLSKLRLLFDDELFIRERHGLQPTSYCLTLLLQVAQVLDTLNVLLEPRIRFSPVTYDKEICIAVNAMLHQTVFNALYSRLRKAAPRARLRFVNWSWDTESKLLNGQINVGVNFSPLDISPLVHASPVLEVDHKICCAKGSDFDRLGVNRGTLSTAGLVLMVISNYANVQSIAERVLRGAGVDPNIIASSDQLESCFSILQNENAGMPVASIIKPNLPEHLILKSFDSSVALPSYTIASHIAYSSLQSPLSKWLLTEIKQALNTL